MAIKIYKDEGSGMIIFDPATIGSKHGEVLHAIGEADGTISVYNKTIPDPVGLTAGQKEIYRLAPTDVLDRTGAVVSAVQATVVNYLNGLFDTASTLGTAPTIISSLAPNAGTGEGINYKIECAVGDNPSLYACTGLPAGLYCDPRDGRICGSSVAAGAHAITLIAINDYGTTATPATLTIGGPFSNAKSTDFNRVLSHHCTIMPAGALKRQPNEPFTWSCWAKRTAAADMQMVMMSGGLRSPTNYEGWMLSTLTGGKVEVFGGLVGSPNKWIKAVSTNVVFSDTTTWHHLAFNYDGTVNFNRLNIDLYIDGALDATAVKTNLNNYDRTTWNAGDWYFSVGRGLQDGSFGGRIDEVSVWNVELTALNIAAIYNAGVPTDLSAHAAWANCVAWYRMGDGDIHPTVADNKAALDLTMYNMSGANFVNDVPA